MRLLKFFLVLLGFFHFSLATMAQEEVPSESFEDPFANPDATTVDPLPSNAPPETSEEPPADEISSESDPSTNDDGFESPASAPTLVPPPQNRGGLVFEDDDPSFEASPPPTQAPAPPTESEFMPPAREDFVFPTTEGERGNAISQDSKKREEIQLRSERGDWSVSASGGAGFNLNRRHTQGALEVAGGYRFTDEWEIGALLTTRFRKDLLLGFLAMAKYGFRLTGPSSIRSELALGLGLGWTLRAPKSKFTEGRLTGRLEVDGLFYAMPRFAILTTLGMESFFLAVDQDGDSVHFLKGKGPPTQLMTLLGVRFDF